MHWSVWDCTEIFVCQTQLLSPTRTFSFFSLCLERQNQRPHLWANIINQRMLVVRTIHKFGPQTHTEHTNHQHTTLSLYLESICSNHQRSTNPSSYNNIPFNLAVVAVACPGTCPFSVHDLVSEIATETGPAKVDMWAWQAVMRMSVFVFAPGLYRVYYSMIYIFGEWYLAATAKRVRVRLFCSWNVCVIYMLNVHICMRCMRLCDYVGWLSLKCL